MQIPCAPRTPGRNVPLDPRCYTCSSFGHHCKSGSLSFGMPRKVPLTPEQRRQEQDRAVLSRVVGRSGHLPTLVPVYSSKLTQITLFLSEFLRDAQNV